MNATLVKECTRIYDEQHLAETIRCAVDRNEEICISGGRHAMGGQQFLDNGVLLDMTRLNNVIRFDPMHGLVEVQGGIMWPALIEYLRNAQRNNPPVTWTIAQKQTGCDQLTIGGAISANAHGRGLKMTPLIGDLENVTVALVDGSIVKCSRVENRELFNLVVGGYGLLGVIVRATLRLVPRTLLRRSVELCCADELVEILDKRVQEGATYGDFQFSIDETSPSFLQQGILSTYTPVESSALISSPENRSLSGDDWRELCYLAHTDKAKAFDKYARHYLSTNNQLYDSDTFQLSTYFDDYHYKVDEKTAGVHAGTEMITELYVPPLLLDAFLKESAAILRRIHPKVIYGTVRMIEADNESCLAWARARYACIVLNMHIDHKPGDMEKARLVFVKLIDLAIACGGSYYLTYHRFARPDQIVACYPTLPYFLAKKRQFDPTQRLQSNWFDYLLKATSAVCQFPEDVHKIDHSLARNAVRDRF
jgi:FAD/FMN-containing dehydrogenase